MHVAREEAQGVQTATAGFEMRATCLLVAFLGALQNGRDTVEVGSAGFSIKRLCSD
jgi:hypothetical protein